MFRPCIHPLDHHSKVSQTGQLNNRNRCVIVPEAEVWDSFICRVDSFWGLRGKDLLPASLLLCRWLFFPFIFTSSSLYTCWRPNFPLLIRAESYRIGGHPNGCIFTWWPLQRPHLWRRSPSGVRGLRTSTQRFWENTIQPITDLYNYFNYMAIDYIENKRTRQK